MMEPCNLVRQLDYKNYLVKYSNQEYQLVSMYHPHIISKPLSFMNFTFKILHWCEVSSHWKKPKNI